MFLHFIFYEVDVTHIALTDNSVTLAYSRWRTSSYRQGFDSDIIAIMFPLIYTLQLNVIYIVKIFTIVYRDARLHHCIIYIYTLSFNMYFKLFRLERKHTL